MTNTFYFDFLYEKNKHILGDIMFHVKLWNTTLIVLHTVIVGISVNIFLLRYTGRIFCINENCFHLKVKQIPEHKNCILLFWKNKPKCWKKN